MTAPTSRDPRTALGVGLGVVASLAFATSGPFGRTLIDSGWSPGAAVFWRTLAGGLLLLPLAVWALRGRLRPLVREWRLVVAFGALGVVTAQALFFAAVARMSVGIALLIEYTAPVALVLWAWVSRRRPPSPLVIAGSATSLLGLLLVLDLTGARPDALGVLFAFGSMIGAAGYFVLSARPSALPPVALAAFGLLAGSAGLGILLASGLLPYAAPLAEVQFLGMVAPWWTSVTVIVVAGTAVAYGLGILGISLMGERLGSFVSLSEVVFAVVLAAVLLGQVPSLVQVVGGVCILTGVVLVRVATTAGPNAPDERDPQPPQRAFQTQDGSGAAPQDSASDAVGSRSTAT